MRQFMPLVAAAALVLSTNAASADLGDQLAKLLPNDGAAEDDFGRSVAMSGTTAIVGAWWHDDNGKQSGSAYLFDISDPANPAQIAKLLPDDGEAADFFGWSVAISGATAIVGAHQDDDNGSLSGSAYLFDTATGRQIAKLLPNDGSAGDVFGNSVSINGTTAIVGAVYDGDNGIESGSAYLFDINTGRQIAKLLPDDGSMYEWFGLSVAISGTTAIVGASRDGENGVGAGAAYLFDAATGRQVTKILPDDGAGTVYFGTSVAISGQTAIVGAFQDTDNGPYSGSAYLFDTATGRQIAKLLALDGAMSDHFGYSVSISGATAIVGAYGDDDNGNLSGSAYLFNNTGQQIAKLLPNDGATFNWFGWSVAIGGAPGKEVAIVGAPFSDDNGDFSGSAYLFTATGTPACPWDLDNNGIVGASDLLALLAQWGTDPGGPPDFDGDGDVGASDLLQLLATWGPCP